MTVLVVLPGLDGTATLHSAFVDAVYAAFDSVAVISYPSNQILDYVALEALVRAELPPVAAFVLLGESFSGPIALSIAANAPPKQRETSTRPNSTAPSPPPSTASAPASATPAEDLVDPFLLFIVSAESLFI